MAGCECRKFTFPLHVPSPRTGFSSGECANQEALRITKQAVWEIVFLHENDGTSN